MRRTLLRSAALRTGLGFLLAGGLVAGMLAVGRPQVGAEATDVEVTGTLALEPDGGIVVAGDSGTYGVVGAIVLFPFLGRQVALQGGIDEGTLYVGGLTLGAIEVQDLEGTATIHTSGTVEETAEGYQVTVEGIAFTLVGSDELDQVVGEEAEIEGELVGTWLALTSLRTADGQEFETHPPDPENA